VTVEGSVAPGVKGWACRLSDHQHGSFRAKVTTPADIPVGLWMCEIEVGVRKHRPKPTVVAKPVHLLFNPWCKGTYLFSFPNIFLQGF